MATRPALCALLVSAVMATACSRPPEQAAADAAAAAAPAPPAHNWIVKEGGEYGYPKALSDDDKKSGQLAEGVVMIRYLGQTDGMYRLATMSGDNYVVMSCAKPCQVVKTFINADVPSLTTRTVFNPSTVMGGAFTDAFNGQLDVYGSSEASTSTQ